MPLPQLNTQGISIIPGIVGGLQARRMMQENALAEMQAQQQAGTTNALQGLNSENDIPNVAMGMLKAGNPKGLELLGHYQTMKAQKQAQQQKMMGEASRILSSVASEPDDAKAAQMYDMGLRQIVGQYPEIGQVVGKTIPDRFDRNWVNMMAQSLVSPDARFQAQQGQYEQVPAQVGGQDTFARFNKRTGTIEPMPQGTAVGAGGFGIQPRPQKAAAEINMAGEKAEDTAYGKFLVDKDFGSIDERAKASEGLIPTLQIARNIDIKTGALEPAKAKVSAVIEGMGFKPESFGLDKAYTAQALTGTMQDVVLRKMQAQKGPQTENDAKRIEMTVANLGQTPEAFDFLLKSAIALEERTVEQRDFYSRFKQETGSFNGAGRAWSEFKRRTPMIAKNPTSKLPVFFNDFRRAMVEANPGITDDQVIAIWREKYGKSQ